MRSEAVVRQFQRLLEPGTVAGLTETEVLERFAERGDPVAFEAIVMRHGPMIYMVCRQMLLDTNDVDDAVQATFLILIKKAGKLRQPERLGPWLYGVAYRVAHRLRTRPTTSDLPANLVGPRLACPVENNEQVAILHDEIQRLPEKYRVPIVLCCIEGLSHDEAASRLGWPVGTVHGRLSRARERLRSRLTRRGGIMSGGVTDLLARIITSQITLPEATRLAVFALLRGTVPASLEILIKGVLTTMIIEKLKQTTIIVFISVVGVGTLTTALRAYQGAAGDPAVLKENKPTQVGERKQEHQTKIVPAARSAPENRADRENNERLAAEAENETAHQELDHELANAAFLQLELDITRKRIEKLIDSFTNFDSSSHATAGADVTTRRRRERMFLQLDADKKTYTEKWRQLAQVKRTIARQSRSLGVAEDSSLNPTDLSRRLDELEQKIDRIIDSLPAK
jgi:RNA polymerase sigma factor (sigma-70 family)